MIIILLLLLHFKAPKKGAQSSLPQNGLGFFHLGGLLSECKLEHQGERFYSFFFRAAALSS